MRPIEETYDDMKCAIFKQAHLFRNKYGGSFEEWVSEANMIFMEAYYSFDYSNKTKFITWLTFLLNKRLTDVIRKKIKESKHIVVLLHGEDVSPEHKCKLLNHNDSRTNISKLFSDVSNDARAIIELIVDTPIDIKIILIGRPKRESIKIKWLNSIKELLEDIGWEKLRVEKSINEIKEAIV